MPVQTEQCCCTPEEWLQEALQKSCKSAGCSSRKFLAAVESLLTAINGAVSVVQKIPESRSALQSGFEKSKNVVTGNGPPLVSTRQRNTSSTIQ